jgi:hypothetical protein
MQDKIEVLVVLDLKDFPCAEVISSMSISLPQNKVDDFLSFIKTQTPNVVATSTVKNTPL